MEWFVVIIYMYLLYHRIGLLSRGRYTTAAITDAYDIAENNSNRISVYSNCSVSSDNSTTGLARRSLIQNDSNGNNNDDLESNNSNSYTSSGNTSTQYLMKIRICSLISCICLVYRYLLPFQFWYRYFCIGPLGSFVIVFIFLFIICFI